MANERRDLRNAVAAGDEPDDLPVGPLDRIGRLTVAPPEVSDGRMRSNDDAAGHGIPPEPRQQSTTNHPKFV